MRARYYSPQLKRFINADVVVGSQTAELLAKYRDDVAKWADEVLGFAKKEGLEVALPDGESIKFWGDSSGNVVKFETEKVSQKNAYKTINEYKAKVNVDQQNKHIPGTNKYKTVLNNGQTKSIIYGDSSDVQKLLNNSAGTGAFIANNKERADCEKIIGQYIDPDTGIKVETTVGIIYYGKKEHI
ncbi:hypothetical protein NDGK_01775 [Clostridiales bacterium CHKCI001]|nr:hypothetical protein NDGK_01775 [Clostridiales bacterium CHKCI001]